MVLPALFFLKKIALAFYGLLWFCLNFRTVFSIFMKNAIGFLWNCIESVDCFGWYGHFNNINSSNP